MLMWPLVTFPHVHVVAPTGCFPPGHQQQQQQLSLSAARNVLWGPIFEISVSCQGSTCTQGLTHLPLLRHLSLGELLQLLADSWCSRLHISAVMP